MLELELQTRETALLDSRPPIDEAQAAYGFVPNLIGMLANAPAAASAYMAVAKAFGASSLTAKEQQVVLLTTSFENRCHYCMAAHSTLGDMVGLPGEVVDALRDGGEIADDRLRAVRDFTASVVKNRGWVPRDEVTAFLDAGFSERHALEVLTGVTLKTLSNYANHLAATPVDETFEGRVWVHPEERAKAEAST